MDSVIRLFTGHPLDDVSREAPLFQKTRPAGTLALPPGLATRDLPDRREVLLAKADRARELLRYVGYVDPEGR